MPKIPGIFTKTFKEICGDAETRINCIRQQLRLKLDERDEYRLDEKMRRRLRIVNSEIKALADELINEERKFDQAKAQFLKRYKRINVVVI